MALEPATVADMVADLKKPEVQNGLKALIGVNAKPQPTMPTTIKVGPYTYTVDQDPSKLRRHEHDLKAPLSGGTTHETTEIHIDPTSSESYKRETLWHETKHAVCNLFGWGGEKSEEDAIGMTAAMELAVLRDNPELVAYLTAP